MISRSLLALSLLGTSACALTAYNETCPDDVETFAVQVQPSVSQDCAACHTVGGPGASSRFVLQPADSDDAVAANLAVLRELADEVGPNGTPLLLLKPTGTHPDGHGGGTVIHEGSETWTVLADFVAWSTGAVEDCSTISTENVDCHGGDPAPGPRLLRRLTHTQYDHTVEDLLGIDADFAGRFAPDDVVDGFANDAHALSVKDLLADQYRTAAETIAEEAVSTRWDEIMPCSARDGEAACAAEFIETVGARAFRRPLTADDVARYHGLWRQVTEETDFRTGIRWTLTALLQSPHFLYRSELGVRDGEAFALTDHELASELSYLAWDTMPDAELTQLADAGELSDPAVLEAQVARLLADPRARHTLGDFVDSWLHLELLDQVTRDDPALTPQIRQHMRGETQRYVASIADDEGTLDDLFLSDHTYVTDELAAHYGIDADGPADSEGYRRTDLGGTPYGGLLTQGSLLTSHALPTGSSPIHRGILVRERMLCQDLPPPPANLDTSPPAVDDTKSTRDRYSQHSEDPACAACHSLIDPIGFAFEGFDGVGRSRDNDNGHPIDDSGWIEQSPTSDSEFLGTPGLAEALVDGGDLQSCYVEMWTRYGFGTQARGLSCAGEQLASSYDRGTLPLTAGLSGLVEFPHFTRRVGEPDEADISWVDPGDPFDHGDDPVHGGGGSGDVVFQLTTASDWGDGFCADGVVRNESDEAVTWRVSTDAASEITSIWNARAETEDATWFFVGDGWNSTLEPGQEASFGFCANR